MGTFEIQFHAVFQSWGWDIGRLRLCHDLKQHGAKSAIQYPQFFVSNQSTPSTSRETSPRRFGATASALRQPINEERFVYVLFCQYDIFKFLKSCRLKLI